VFLSGALAALAMAPVHFSPILFLSFPAFFLILNESLTHRTPRQQKRMAFWLGWCFGFGYFLAGLWWIGAAVLVDGATFAWALPFAVAGIPAALALFWAFASVAAIMFWQSTTLKIISLVFFLSFAEYLRGFILTGFPWNALGYGAMPTVLFMQSASVVGLWGMTAFTFLAAFSPVLLVLPCTGRERQRARILLICVVTGLVAHTGFGVLRLSEAGQQVTAEDPVRLRLLQPNISQQDKWRPGNEEAVLQTYLDLSSAPGLSGVDALIWPESAFPFLVLQREDVLARLDMLLPEGVRLIAGAVRIKPETQTDADPRTRPEFYNSVIELSDRARPVGFYDKLRLVPFGEFVPFADIAERFGITKLVNTPGGFATGLAGNRYYFDDSVSSGKALPPALFLICYEAIFPDFQSRVSQTDEASGPSSRPAEWILNVTNDAWFGPLAGPYQHFHQARLRAVEAGLPMIRVANTGISAVIDAYGRVQKSLPLGTAGIIDTALPPALPSAHQTRSPDLPFALLMALLGFLLLAGRMLIAPSNPA
jgi:apolipoprotein N-acyltransferase